MVRFRRLTDGQLLVLGGFEAFALLEKGDSKGTEALAPRRDIQAAGSVSKGVLDEAVGEVGGGGFHDASSEHLPTKWAKGNSLLVVAAIV